MQHELSERAREYQLLFEDAPVACLRIDTDGLITAVKFEHCWQ